MVEAHWMQLLRLLLLGFYLGWIVCGFCRDAHALPHEEQSCVHSSAIMFTSASDSWGIIASVWECVKLS